ncbi:hypothetical protein LJY18_02645 [Pseudomonas sp. MMS21-TM103]|uniref:hypothetical protein n=1 Tax=Pseudomonas sp. MMS21 TM103 TaxID=2886506 RepID=UPI001EDE17B3|nr:hypothetical protein [Pseudomonas sp. MMS21 TM103]MCG4452200.1 hypothetical protein [Pseudomonas sp. MMS21 TM103]
MKLQSIMLGALALLLLQSAVLAKDKREYTDSFPLGECDFASVGENQYFPLQPGREAHFNNAQCVAEGECTEVEELVIRVLDDTRDVTLAINGEATTVTTRIVEERETANGQLVEISRNFFAECAASQDVYYFGEEVDIYQAGVIVSHEGEWLAGTDAALPGIIMPGGAFLLGSRYFQEVAPEVAMDRAEHIAADLSLEVAAGAMEGCVEVEESTELDRKSLSTKIYCPGAGLVVDDDLELTFVLEP